MCIRDSEYVTPLEIHFRELNAQPPFAPVLPIPEQEVTETEPESEPSVETAETAAEPAEEPVTDTMPQNLSDNEYAIYTALRDAGLSKAGTAAVMGCMAMESGLRVTAENPNDGGYGLLPVSYTHLDVYKRQMQYYGTGFCVNAEQMRRSDVIDHRMHRVGNKSLRFPERIEPGKVFEHFVNHTCI